MKFIYPAVFHEEKDGKYKGYFPDLECCYGEGDTIDVSDEEDIDLKEGEFIRNISVNIRFYEGWDE